MAISQCTLLETFSLHGLYCFGFGGFGLNCLVPVQCIGLALLHGTNYYYLIEIEEAYVCHLGKE